jgi:hypothetical protein
MLTLRCTQKLMKRMKVKPADAAASSTVLGDWYANYAILQRRHLVICCAQRSLLPAVVAASPLSTLAERIRAALGALLRDLGVSDTSIGQELDAMNDVVIAKTNDRSIVGVLNDYVRLAEACDESLHEMSLFLAQTPIFAATPHTIWPKEATIELFAREPAALH